jgi:hypothetical protein
MGWTTTHVEKGQAGEYMKKLFVGDNDVSKLELLQGAFVGWSEYYAAVKRTIKSTGESYVFAVAVMVHYYPHDHHNFGYKDMDESMGPNIAQCPESILKLLSPSETVDKICGYTHKYAKDWRVRCWENVLRKKTQKALTNGAIIKFSAPIKFTNGETRDTFAILKQGHKTKFCAYNEETKRIWTQSLYRITGMKRMEYSVIGKIAA